MTGERNKTGGFLTNAALNYYFLGHNLCERNESFGKPRVRGLVVCNCAGLATFIAAPTIFCATGARQEIKEPEQKGHSFKVLYFKGL